MLAFMKKTLGRGLTCAVIGGAIVGGPLALFIAGTTVTSLVFGASVGMIIGGGLTAVTHTITGMFSPAPSKESNRGAAAGAVVLLAGAALMWHNGLPRAQAAKEGISAGFNCPAARTVMQTTTQPDGTRTVTMTCLPKK